MSSWRLCIPVVSGLRPPKPDTVELDSLKASFQITNQIVYIFDAD